MRAGNGWHAVTWGLCWLWQSRCKHSVSFMFILSNSFKSQPLFIFRSHPPWGNHRQPSKFQSGREFTSSRICTPWQGAGANLLPLSFLPQRIAASRVWAVKGSARLQEPHKITTTRTCLAEMFNTAFLLCRSTIMQSMQFQVLKEILEF